MRFGHFFYPMRFDDSNDYQAIQDCLDEAILAEELGYDAIWLAEHYFTGECVYGDPLVFASAVAVQTKKIEIGFGILELPLHNPVRVAIQTALLDNLCQGRLIVGTAKGSNYNAYEYIGFGSNPEIGVQQLDEAEELLIKAWTTDNLEFKGEYFEVSVPSMRPRPFQKPHPRLARACLNAESIAEMARIGRPVLLRGRSTNHVGDGISLYRETMEESGFDDATIEANLDQIWVWREIHLAKPMSRPSTSSCPLSTRPTWSWRASATSTTLRSTPWTVRPRRFPARCTAPGRTPASTRYWSAAPSGLPSTCGNCAMQGCET